MKNDKIAMVLDDLLKSPDIYACLIGRYNMISVMPDKMEFKTDINEMWDILYNTINDGFYLIKKYADAGLGEMFFRLQDYNIIFYILPNTENAIVTITPKMEKDDTINKKLDNARNKIIQLMEEEKTINN